jgi:LysR family hydrogen peroxide-inducible transcriptional activator
VELVTRIITRGWRVPVVAVALAAIVGVSLIPEMAIDRNVGCCYVRLSDIQATRTIVVAVLHGRNLNRVQRAFLSGLRGRAAEARRGKASAANRSTRG